jgi:hypothetical protein
MNLITLTDAQLALVRSTLQKAADDLLQDMNAEQDWSNVLIDLANDHADLIDSTIKELNDCQTPKVIKAPTLQQAPAWEGTTSAAKVLGVEAKKLYNLKQNGKLRPGYHFRKESKAITWNVATVGQFLSENSH